MGVRLKSRLETKCGQLDYQKNKIRNNEKVLRYLFIYIFGRKFPLAFLFKNFSYRLHESSLNFGFFGTLS